MRLKGMGVGRRLSSARAVPGVKSPEPRARPAAPAVPRNSRRDSAGFKRCACPRWRRERIGLLLILLRSFHGDLRVYGPNIAVPDFPIPSELYREAHNWAGWR